MALAPKAEVPQPYRSFRPAGRPGLAVLAGAANDRPRSVRDLPVPRISLQWHLGLTEPIVLRFALLGTGCRW